MHAEGPTPRRSTTGRSRDRLRRRRPGDWRAVRVTRDRDQVELLVVQVDDVQRGVVRRQGDRSQPDRAHLGVSNRVVEPVVPRPGIGSAGWPRVLSGVGDGDERRSVRHAAGLGQIDLAQPTRADRRCSLEERAAEDVLVIDGGDAPHRARLRDSGLRRAVLAGLRELLGAECHDGPQIGRGPRPVGVDHRPLLGGRQLRVSTVEVTRLGEAVVGNIAVCDELHRRTVVLSSAGRDEAVRGRELQANVGPVARSVVGQRVAAVGAGLRRPDLRPRGIERDDGDAFDSHIPGAAVVGSVRFVDPVEAVVAEHRARHTARRRGRRRRGRPDHQHRHRQRSRRTDGRPAPAATPNGIPVGPPSSRCPESRTPWKHPSSLFPRTVCRQHVDADPMATPAFTAQNTGQHRRVIAHSTFMRDTARDVRESARRRRTSRAGMPGGVATGSRPDDARQRSPEGSRRFPTPWSLRTPSARPARRAAPGSA